MNLQQPRVFGRMLWLAGVVAAMLVLATCGSDDATAPDDDSQGGGTIGPAGGTVTDANGASVTIPPGALDQDVAITIAGATGQDDLPAGGAGLMPSLGGVSCGPDGTTFLAPVTVTIPALEPLTPGNLVPLHVWDAGAGGWAATPFVATVDASGSSFTGEVTHFSFFNGLSGSGGMLTSVDQQLCAGVAAAAILATFQQQFRAEIAAVGDHGIWDQECREVVGLHWDLHAETNGEAADIITLEGEEGDESLMVSWQVTCSSGENAGNSLDAIVTIHHSCSPPDLSAVADPTDIGTGETSTITASVSCDGQPMAGRGVSFECFGPPGIDAAQATTDAAGQARTTYTNEGEEGRASIHAQHDACAGTDHSETTTATAEVDIEDDWRGTLTVDFQQSVGDGPLGVFEDAVQVDFTFSVETEEVSGEGPLSHNVEITPGDADCWLSGVNAPSFPVAVSGSTTEEQVQLFFAPMGAMPLTFVITCDPEEPQDYTYPGHGLMEGLAITEDIVPTLPFEDGASTSGSGSQDFGDGIPLTYSWTVTLQHSE